MRYFEKYLKDQQSIDDIDISVHCDVKIFEWLMRYLKDPDPPKLDIKNVISILISSDFLKMARLVGLCIEFIVANLADVVRLPIDLSCLNSHLLKKIAALVDIDVLDALRDRKDRLTSKLFMKKLEALLQGEESSTTQGNFNNSETTQQFFPLSNTLYLCAYCS